MILTTSLVAASHLQNLTHTTYMGHIRDPRSDHPSPIQGLAEWPLTTLY